MPSSEVINHTPVLHATIVIVPSFNEYTLSRPGRPSESIRMLPRFQIRNFRIIQNIDLQIWTWENADRAPKYLS
jgi:hypothetical protein